VRDRKSEREGKRERERLRKIEREYLLTFIGTI
jgi:hypothetical protein